MNRPKRQTQALGDVVAEVLARRGINRPRSNERLCEAWQQAVAPDVARKTCVVALRHRTLEVLVQNSILLQELAGFQMQPILSKLRECLPDADLRGIRFRLASELD